MRIFFRYNSTTGIYTVPSAGVYFVMVYAHGDDKQWNKLLLQLNGVTKCIVGMDDNTDNWDNPEGVCSFLDELNAGDPRFHASSR